MSDSVDQVRETALKYLRVGEVRVAIAIIEQALPRQHATANDLTVADAELATVYAKALTDDGRTESAQQWALFASDLAARLTGVAGAPTVRAYSILAQAQIAAGRDDLAIGSLAALTEALHNSRGPNDMLTICADADLAAVLHRRGFCDRARQLMAGAATAVDRVAGPGHRTSITMRARLGTMLRDCGRFDQAHVALDDARTRCRANLPSTDPLSSQVTKMARAAANPHHECTPTATQAYDTRQPGRA